ncbi:MAG: nucleotide exchange factor GrpE [Bdellovibrionales bacterium]|nr:nucleotide exchange factor GrpE [Bdellovibrionales bacterium]
MSEVPPNTPASEPTGQPESTAASGGNPVAEKLAQLENQLKAEQQKYVYLYADFENYKKRAVKDRADAVKFGFENAARDILQVADNLQRAVEHIPETTDKNLRAGIQMVLDQLNSTLQRHGVEAVVTQGQAFDPNLHEAVGQLPSEKPAGQVIQEHQKGYTLHGRLLRPARVVISSGPAPAGPNA